MKSPRAARPGFSLIEALLAIIIISVGTLAVASGIGFVFSALRAGQVNTERSMAITEAVEELRSTAQRSYSTVTSRSSATPDTIGNYQVWWTVTDSTTTLKKVVVYVQGMGLSSGSKWSTTKVDTFRMSIAKP